MRPRPCTSKSTLPPLFPLNPGSKAALEIRMATIFRAVSASVRASLHITRGFSAAASKEYRKHGVFASASALSVHFGF